MFQVKFSEHAVKELRKLDKPTVRVIKNWVIKNLVDTTDPRMHGKALTGNLKGIWRYRVGDYRLFAEIHDEELIIFLFEIAHRREVYKRQ
jgi:mRNA interferase RelE/StbE